ncbi:MAG: twin-arginine translocase subunit TatC [Deltaproteobacteria bacterium]|nr:twin-arginine translocase subunit TatC [Deltaproteobacteria bacterium]
MTEPAQAPPDSENPAEPEGEVRASFWDHLKELRTRLAHALIGVAVGTAATGIYAEQIFRFVMKPVLASLPEGQRALNYTSYLEPFLVYLKVALYGGTFVAAPWVLWQLWLFVAPGLYRREKRMVVPFLASGTTLFYAGAAFCYFLVMPYAFPALASIAGPDMRPLLTMREQLTLVLAMLLGFGIIFEVPVVIAFLSIVGIVDYKFLAKYRRHAVIVNVLVAALVTPTGDPFNLALMAVPMIVFYEVGILLARVLGKKPAPEPEAEAQAGQAKA